MVRPVPIFFLCSAAVATSAMAREPDAGHLSWRTGPDLQRKLAEPTNLAWSGRPLRLGLANLSRASGVAILLDRRIDPGQLLELTLNDVPLKQALERIAAEHGAAVSWFGPLAYLGPEPSARRLRTLAAMQRADSAQLPLPARRALARERPWRWDDLATPRDLLAGLAVEADLPIENLDRVPHDLWASADLPPLTLSDRLTLVAVQFDLVFLVDESGRTLTLEPLPGEIVVERTYPGGPRAQETANRWSRLAPDSRIEVRSGRIVVRGLVEDHERLVPPKAPSPAAPLDTATKLYTLTVRDKPLEAVLAHLEAQLKLDMRINNEAIEQAGISLSDNISFEVKDATLDELLAATLEPAGLAFRRQGQIVEVFPAE